VIHTSIHKSTFTAHNTNKKQFTFISALLYLFLFSLLTACGQGGSSKPPTLDTNEEVKLTFILGSSITLDASEESNLSSDTATYQWKIIEVPESSALTELNDPSSMTTTFAPDVKGEYKLSLIISEGNTVSSSILFSITVEDDFTNITVPQANAGENRSALIDSEVSLNGSGIFTDNFEYQWTLDSAPSGSSITTSDLSDTTIANPIFIPDVPGDYIFTLVIKSGELSSRPSEIKITVVAENTAPVANAGPDQTVSSLSLVTLDGSSSFDAESGSLTYSWSMTTPSGSKAELAITNPEHPSFTPDLDGEYIILLSIFDGKDNSEVDTVIITVNTPNVAPVANAGSYQPVDTLSLVTLNGSASSDSDGDSLLFTWNMTPPSGSSAVLNTSAPENPSFTPDIDGEYEISLSVFDGEDNSAVDTVIITAKTANIAPIANAGSYQPVDTLSLVTLDGSASSDEDGDALNYSWSMTTPINSIAELDNKTSEKPSFTPDIDGEYQISLSVSDGKDNSALTDTVTITASTPKEPNLPPVANAGPDQSVDTLSIVTLDGSASSDEDGNALNYNWSMTTPDGSSAELDNAMSKNPSFTPDIDGEYQISLSVYDGEDTSVLIDTAIITAKTANLPPIAVAGPNQFIAVNDTVYLDGSDSYDPEESEISYSWEIAESPTGSSATLTDDLSATTMFTPDVVGEYIVTLIVSDGEKTSQVSTVIAVAGTAEGSKSEPKILLYTPPSPLQYTGNVQRISSFYQVHNLNSSIYYHIYLTELDDNVDLIVYDDSAFTNVICESHNSFVRHENCIGKAIENSSSLYIEVNGNLAVHNAQYVLNITPAVDEGTEEAPVVISLDTPYLGTTKTSTSYYEVKGINYSKNYVVSLKDKTNSLELWGGNNNITRKCRSSDLDKNNLCNIQGDPSGTLYIKIYHNVGTLFGGKSFELFVTEGKAVKSEGTVSSPIPLTYSGSLLQHTSGKVDTNTSYYQLTGLTAGADYDVWLPALNENLYLEIQDESGTTISAKNFPKQFTFKATTSIANIRVHGDESKIGANFTLSVQENNVQPVSEGMITDPIVLSYDTAVDSLLHIGSVDTSNSYYKVIGLSLNRKLVFSISDLSDDIDLSVYSDSGYSNLICESSLFDQNSDYCTHFISNSTAYIKVKGNKTWKGTVFKLKVAPPLFEAEGSSEKPIQLDAALVTSTGHDGAVDYEYSYYEIVDLINDTPYEVRLELPSRDVDLYVYTTADFSSSPACKSEDWEDSYVENCIATTVSTSLFVKVSGLWSGGGAKFLLKATEK